MTFCPCVCVLRWSNFDFVLRCGGIRIYRKYVVIWSDDCINWKKKYSNLAKQLMRIAPANHLNPDRLLPIIFACDRFLFAASQLRDAIDTWQSRCLLFAFPYKQLCHFRFVSELTLHTCSTAWSSAAIQKLRIKNEILTNYWNSFLSFVFRKPMTFTFNFLIWTDGSFECQCEVSVLLVFRQRKKNNSNFSCEIRNTLSAFDRRYVSLNSSPFHLLSYKLYTKYCVTQCDGNQCD